MTSTIFLGIPHGGTRVPPSVAPLLRPDIDAQFILSQSDAYSYELFSDLGTDYHALEWSRLVVDANRTPRSRRSSGPVPLVDFDNRSLFIRGKEPSEEQILARIERWHAPYHAEVARRLDEGNYRLFIDGHSMAATAPARSPDQRGARPLAILGNGGDEKGELAADARTLSCPPAFARQALELLKHAFADHPAPPAPRLVSSQGELVLNRIFRGGYGVRHHSKPQTGRYGLQLELNQGLWCDPHDFRPDSRRLEWMQEVLKQWLSELDALISV